MIAGNEDHPGAGIHLAQNLRHHLALCVRPIPAALQLPTIDNIPHQKQRGAVIVRQEIGQASALQPRVPRCVSEMR